MVAVVDVDINYCHERRYVDVALDYLSSVVVKNLNFSGFTAGRAGGAGVAPSPPPASLHIVPDSRGIFQIFQFYCILQFTFPVLPTRIGR